MVFGLGGAGAIRAQSQGSMNLRLRRSNEGVELVIEGVGAQPLLQQRLNGQVWEGSLQPRGAPGVRAEWATVEVEGYAESVQERGQ